MACKGCGKGNRYKDMVNDSTGLGQGEREYIESEHPHSHTHSDSGNVGEDERIFNELNSMSFAELEAVKEESGASFYKAFIDSFKHMSDDFKASQILNLVDIANGDKFSSQGHSPEYCIKLLNKLLSLDIFSVVNEKFPELKEQVDKKFAANQKLKIIV